MSLAILAIIAIAICLIGTWIATAIFSLVDDEDATEAMTGDDYPNARETADR